MSPNPQSDRVAELFLAWIELSAGERQQRMQGLREHDPALAQDLDRLLARFDADAQAPDFTELLPRDDVDAAGGTAGERLGPFALDREIGRGGMGTVWRAHRVDGQYEQQVAIKRLLAVSAGGGDARAVIERFLRERQTLAGLKHPHIASLIDGGIDAAGLPWFALELVDGLPITHYVARHGLGVPARLRLLLQALQAVQFAHQRLIVHRDLKPDNLLVTTTGEVKLLDFGIVKLLDDVDGERHTVTGARLFTPNYAAPEQVEGGAIGVATDVYALGVVIYELLVGQRPFATRGQGLQLPQVIAQWKAEAPSRALARLAGSDRLARKLRGDLDTIVLRCLARETARRYPTVQAVHDDIERFLDGRPILARPDSATYRAGKFLRRHPLGVAAAAAGIGLLVASTAFSVMQSQRAGYEAKRALQFATTAESERDLALIETRRQELLREHYASVLNRAMSSGSAIDPRVLLDMIADVGRSAAASDPGSRRTIHLGLAELFVSRNDFPRAIAMLEALAAEREQLSILEQVAYAESLGTSYLRTGAMDRFEAVLADGEAAARRAGDRRAASEAILLVLRAQWLRMQAQPDAAYETALRAVERVGHAPRMSALAHGQVLLNAAQTALLVGRLDDADRLQREGIARWDAGGLQRSVNYRTAQTLQANLTVLRGRPREALTLFERLAGDDGDSEEPAVAAAARRSSQARVLSMLARHDEAIALARDAGRRFCAQMPGVAPDCVRIRLMLVDVALAAGQAGLARRELAEVVAQAGNPPAQSLAILFDAYGALVRLAEHAGAAEIDAAARTLDALAAQNPGASRAALRLRLTAAEGLLDAGRTSQATALMAPVLGNPTSDAGLAAGGLDDTLLRLWRGRESGAPDGAQPAALRTLAELLGPAHPSVVRWGR
jgi:hypothetical protein